MPTPTRPRRLAADHFRALAAAGLRTPIGTDLILHERADPEAVRLDGRRLAGVVREAAERYRTPLAIPLMDLRLEKADLVRRVRPDVIEPDTFHLDAPPSEAEHGRAHAAETAPFLPAHRAHLDAIAEIAARSGLTPLGMAIGPFSLATKLLADPIAAVALAGRGIRAEDEPLVALAERGLALAELAVHRSLRAQVEAVRVHRAHRSGGIGTALMQWAIARARTRGARGMQLTTNKVRSDAHRFYERLGFAASHEGMKLALRQDTDPPTT